jgi:hypothetical protein
MSGNSIRKVSPVSCLQSAYCPLPTSHVPTVTSSHQPRNEFRATSFVSLLTITVFPTPLLLTIFALTSSCRLPPLVFRSGLKNAAVFTNVIPARLRAETPHFGVQARLKRPARRRPARTTWSGGSGGESRQRFLDSRQRHSKVTRAFQMSSNLLSAICLLPPASFPDPSCYLHTIFA